MNRHFPKITARFSFFRARTSQRTRGSLPSRIAKFLWSFPVEFEETHGRASIDPFLWPLFLCDRSNSFSRLFHGRCSPTVSPNRGSLPKLLYVGVTNEHKNSMEKSTKKQLQSLYFKPARSNHWVAVGL